MTENGAVAFPTTGNTCLDFFTMTVRNMEIEKAINMFFESYETDPELTLKIILNLRDVRNGKGEKLLSLIMMFLLKKINKKFYEDNLEYFAKDIGCLKDLLKLYEIDIRMTINDGNKKNFTKEKINKSILEKELLILNDLMNTDLKKLEENKLNTINKITSLSLVGKWLPNLNSHYDHHPLYMATKIKLYNNWTNKEYRTKTKILRDELNLIETNMCQELHDKIDFSKIPSIAHLKLRKSFDRDVNSKGVQKENRRLLKEKYKLYLESVKKGEAKINSKGIQPHELVSKYCTSQSELDETIEVQWNDLVQKLSILGKFNKTQAVVDVSGSMSGTPMEVAISLGLIISQLTNEPFNNKIVTFSSNPQFHNIVGKNLKEKVQNLQTANWGMNTNFIKVFELLLQHAQFFNLPQDQMVETLFIFTDMQFDVANRIKSDESINNDINTTYNIIKNMFSETIYTPPKIIFWNLRSSINAFPVVENQEGVSLMSGFSAEMLKLFLDGEDISPLKMLMKAMEKYNVNTTNIENTSIEKSVFNSDFISSLKIVIDKIKIKNKLVDISNNEKNMNNDNNSHDNSDDNSNNSDEEITWTVDSTEWK